jgi:nucleoside-diphosphate-sugar epimerase
VEEILGDRETDLGRLAGRSWDAVVDTCGFRPEHVGASAAALADAVDRYVFISTAGVYRDWPEAPIPGEEAPLHEGDEDDYSVLKAASERAAEAAMPGRVAQVRPGTIVGPHENIGRLPWWLDRMARGGAVMAPGPPDAPIQVIDARDLAEFALDAPPGAYNAIGEPGHATWGELLEACRAVTGGGAELVWTEPELVLAEVEEPWDQLPIWPSPAYPGLFGVWPRRALEAGLRTRPVAETVADTWAWLSAPDGELSEWRSELRARGLDPEIERALLAAS